jgi:large subunit ribosomal protein L4e
MKATLYTSNGTKKSEVELPLVFHTKIREDLVQKYFEVDKLKHPYSPYVEAGRRHSASGTVSHKRHDWKGHYGKGMSRIPRKTMWRRGTQFFWIGAEISGTRGGRQAHPPKGIGHERKINRKEVKLAMDSAFAATANKDYVSSRYTSSSKFGSVPFVIESLPSKTKDLRLTLKGILGEHFTVAFKKKNVRAGRGTRRGRKYKSSAGALVVVSSKEKHNFKGIHLVPANEVTISDLYPLGRLTVYTKAALEELSNPVKEKTQ